MTGLVIRLNSILPPTKLHVPADRQSAEDTAQRRVLHKAHGGTPIFQFSEGCRTDEVLGLLDRASLKLTEPRCLIMEIPKGTTLATRPVTILSFKPDGAYAPRVAPRQREGLTPEEAQEEADNVFWSWLVKQLNRSWDGGQLWTYGSDQPAVLNLLNPHALDLRDEHIPLYNYLFPRVAQSA